MIGVIITRYNPGTSGDHGPLRGPDDEQLSPGDDAPPPRPPLPRPEDYFTQSATSDQDQKSPSTKNKGPPP